MSDNTGESVGADETGQQPSADTAPAPDRASTMGLVQPLSTLIPADEIPKVRSALVRYRVMAYTVGVLLVVLMLFAVPMKYFGNDDRWVTWFGVPHGWLYMLLILTAIDLGRRVKWSLRNVVLIALAGTIPFLSFVAEYFARKDVHRRIARSTATELR